MPTSQGGRSDGRWRRSEDYHALQALLLCSALLLLGYHGIVYGPAEYTLLENGGIVGGYVQSPAGTLTIGLGYATGLHSWISLTTAGMLLYSLISRNPGWSLPSIGLCLTDLVRDVADGSLIVWLLFTNQHPSIALLYAASLLSLLLCELWIWLGALRLYERRAFRRFDR